MVVINKVIAFLRKPFPQEESNMQSVKIILATSLFVTLFLYLFEPFDMHEAKPNLFVICLGFGLITFISNLIYEFIIARLLRLKGPKVNFTLGRCLIYLTGLMLCISFANFIFIRLIFFGYILWEFYPYMIRSTFIIGIFPTIALCVFGLLQQERKYLKIAAEINEQKPVPQDSNLPHNISILDIPIQEIRYVEALQNYVKLGYLNEEGQLIEKTERITLKSIMDDVYGSSLVKCHRSYLVNKDVIVSTSGNAQGLLLSLSDCEKLIPVSRSFVSAFRN